MTRARVYACRQGRRPVVESNTSDLVRTSCNNLAKLWSGAKPKLDKCVDAAFQPKASASNENCQSFRTQFDAYKAALPLTPTGADPANRLGEQFGRWEVIKHVFETRFLPSIPANGYSTERSACPVVDSMIRFGARDSRPAAVCSNAHRRSCLDRATGAPAGLIR